MNKELIQKTIGEISDAFRVGDAEHGSQLEQGLFLTFIHHVMATGPRRLRELAKAVLEVREIERGG